MSLEFSWDRKTVSGFDRRREWEGETRRTTALDFRRGLGVGADLGG